MKKQLILIDTSWVIHRAWWTHKDLKVKLLNGDKLPSGHLYGLTRLLKSITLGYPEADIYLCLDGRAKHGKMLSSSYKANRTPGTVSTAFDDLGVMLECSYAYGINVSYHPDLEADEVISYLVDKYSKEYEKVIIYAGDNDMLQLLGDNVYVSTKLRSGKFELVSRESYLKDEKMFIKYQGVEPSKLPLYRAFVGDSSDNLSGYPRIRKKLVKEIVDKYSSLENIVLGIANKDPLFADGMQSYVETLISNYRIMKLPGVAELEELMTIPIEHKDLGEYAVEMYSLYRIKSTSPVDVYPLTDELENKFMEIREKLNSQWRRPKK